MNLFRKGITMRSPMIIVALILFWVFVLTGSSFAAYDVKKTVLRIKATAGETLTTGDVVCIKDADGYAYKADADDSNLRPAVGIIGSKDGASGATVEVIIIGIVDGWTSLSEGGDAFLSDTAGAVTQSGPSWSQKIGMAINTTQYLINCGANLSTSGITAVGTLTGATPITMEGATSDAYETSIAVTDPTADRTITLPNTSGTVMLASGVEGAANAVAGANNGFVCEGATADAYETTISVTDPTADNTVTIPDDSGNLLVFANANTQDENIVMEGATADAYETTLAFTDATADRTITLPDETGNVLTFENANTQDVTIVMEGTTSDDYETTVTFTDPTADRTVTVPNATGTVILASGAADAANAVSGTNNGFICEGATADGFETTISVTDPTADNTVTIPDDSGSVLIFENANTQDVNIVFEGATADAYETTVTVTDPTADRTVTIPNLSGNVLLFANAGTQDQNIVIEGATADDYETTLAFTDPTVDRTITLPDYAGDIPIVVAQGATQTSATNQTQDVTGSSVSLADGHFGAGKTLKWTIAGTISGGNAAKNIILYVDNAAIITLATQAATTGDYLAEFYMHEHTDFANQKCFGKAIIAAGTDVEMDYATDTTDFNDGGATTVKCQIVSGNAGDTITAEYVLVEFMN